MRDRTPHKRDFLKVYLQRRQDLERHAPESVFWRGSLRKVDIFVLSYAWQSAAHPDPHGKIALALGRMLDLRGTGADGVPTEKFGWG